MFAERATDTKELSSAAFPLPSGRPPLVSAVAPAWPSGSAAQQLSEWCDMPKLRSLAGPPSTGDAADAGARQNSGAASCSTCGAERSSRRRLLSTYVEAGWTDGGFWLPPSAKLAFRLLAGGSREGGRFALSVSAQKSRLPLAAARL